MSSLALIDTKGLGNTRPSPCNEKRVRRWCFTYNNYTEDFWHNCHIVFNCDKYIIGQEVGCHGTPHLQGYLEFKNGIRLSTLKKIDSKIHFEQAKGNREQNIKYCSKENNYKTNFDMPIDVKAIIKETEYKDVVWKPWQKNILDLLESKPNRRTINWFYDDEGNVGKSFLALYLGITHDIIICDGKRDNIFNQIKIWREENKSKMNPDLILMDIPRCNQELHISYSCLESIKNGMLYSGKYEGGQIYLGPVHVVVFSNQEPDYSKLSEDRWNVVKIGEC